MNWKKTGWLLVVMMGLISCRSKHASDNNYQIMNCSEGTESLSLDLKDQVARFTEDLRNYQSGYLSAAAFSRSATQTADLCWEFNNAFPMEASSCTSYDAFGGNSVEIQRNSYRYECDLANQYAEPGSRRDHHGRDSRDHSRGGHSRSWADQALKNLKTREIALSIINLRALSNRKAWVNGQEVSYSKGEAAAQRGQTSCAVRTSRGLQEGTPLPVVRITDNSRRGIQSYTLITKEGLQVSCQTAAQEELTPRAVQKALGSVIQVRH